jgi:hypothetical protein
MTADLEMTMQSGSSTCVHRRSSTAAYIRVLALAALGVLLGGCFISNEAKFPLATAAPVFGEGGRFLGYDRVDSGFKPGGTFTIKHNSDGGYQFVADNGDTLPISFHRISDGVYVGQNKDDQIKGYQYAIFRVTGAETLVIHPQCSEQDKAKLAEFGVVFNSDSECAIDRVSDPAGLFATLKLGEPASKFTRE